MSHCEIRSHRTPIFAGITTLLFLTCDVLAQGRVRSAHIAYSVAYTGGLLGYARTPESQTIKDQFCKDLRDSAPPAISPFTTAMLNLAQEGHSLLIGMGNNFSPDLYARTFEPTSIGPYRESKDRFQWDRRTSMWIRSQTNGPSVPNGPIIQMDNVACFFRIARYAAIVPGKDDFWFGPARLQQIARMLARPRTPEEAASSQPVQMLAANLAIVTTVANQNGRLPNYLKEADEPGYNLKIVDGTLAVDLPGTVLPYLRQFRFKNARVYINAATQQVE